MAHILRKFKRTLYAAQTLAENVSNHQDFFIKVGERARIVYCADEDVNIESGIVESEKKNYEKAALRLPPPYAVPK